MIQVKFKNLDRSELAKEAVTERLDVMIEKFPDLKQSKITVTLEMENSPVQAGPDVFKVKLHISGGRYDGIILTKSEGNLYRALADTMEHMLEKLNRAGDKDRVKKRAKARQFARQIEKSFSSAG